MEAVLVLRISTKTHDRIKCGTPCVVKSDGKRGILRADTLLKQRALQGNLQDVTAVPKRRSPNAQNTRLNEREWNHDVDSPQISSSMIVLELLDMTL